MTNEKTKKTMRGIVTRKSGTETIRVEVKITKVHPLYRKRYTQTRHYIAHDPGDKTAIGQEVTIVPCRPISRTKQWIVEA